MPSKTTKQNQKNLWKHSILTSPSLKNTNGGGSSSFPLGLTSVQRKISVCLSATTGLHNHHPAQIYCLRKAKISNCLRTFKFIQQNKSSLKQDMFKLIPLHAKSRNPKFTSLETSKCLLRLFLLQGILGPEILWHETPGTILKGSHDLIQQGLGGSLSVWTVWQQQRGQASRSRGKGFPSGRVGREHKLSPKGPAVVKEWEGGAGKYGG